MKHKLFSKTIKGDIVIIDSMFPQKEPFGFRNTEINEYFKRTKNIESYAMYPMKPWGDAWFPWSYGVEQEVYEKNKKSYLEHYPENANRIHYIDENKSYRFKLAYSYFLADTYVLLPFYERNKIPFVFVLYPGGTFGIDNESSDKMLARILKSEYFRGVIVTQKLTRDYLLRKDFCHKDKIHYIFGGFSQFKAIDVKPKKYYKKDKKTFDICFVAGKYSEQGRDKGYDLFVETAKLLSKNINDIRFHIVGGLGYDDIELGDAASTFTFYGYKPPEFLIDFYTSMDVFLSPNRPGVLYEGNFDGFPMGLDAPFCGVAQFASDELSMNRGSFVDGEDIVIAPLNAKSITEKVKYYYDSPHQLYELSRKGQAKAQKFFNIQFQISERMKVLAKTAPLKLENE